MAIDRNKLNISTFTDSEVFEIQNSALLVDVDENPIFVAPVIASGEEFSSFVLGATPADAIPPTPTGTEDTNRGPTVITGTETDDIITTLQQDIPGYFINSTDFATGDDVNRFFTGSPVASDPIVSSDVCVVGGVPTTEVPVVSRDPAAVLAAYQASKPKSLLVTDISHIPDDAFTYTGNGFNKQFQPTHSDGWNGAKVSQKKALRNAVQALPIVKNCNTGTYHSQFTINQYYYTTPYRMSDPITVTGYNYTDTNGGSGVITDDTLPTTYVNTTHPYTAGNPEFTRLDSVLTAAGQSAIAGKSFNISIKFVRLGSVGSIQEPTTDNKNVIGAITELDTELKTAATQASTVETSVWVEGVGDWRKSQVQDIDDPNDPGTNTITNPDFDSESYNQLISINPDWDSQIAWRKLNLIPVLSKDKILVEKFIPNPDPALSGEPIRLLELDLDSQVNLLEATYTLWRNISADMSNTYGVDSIITPGAPAHTLIEPLTGNSHVEVFNMLYMSLSALSGDMTTIKHAISGTGDVLINNLSGNSIYNNLNTIYTGLTAVEDCCDTNTINITSLSAAISGLPALSTGNTTITTLISGTSGDVLIPELSGDSIIKNINNIYTGLTANVECCDTNTMAITSLQDCCDTNTASITALSTLVTNLTGTGGGDLTNIQYAISGDGSDVLVTNLSGDNIFENLNLLYYELSGFTDCCDLIKTHLSGGNDTTITKQLSTLIENNAIDISVLSGCCDTNTDAIDILKTIIYGSSQTDVFHTNLTGSSIITNINTLYTTLSGLVGAPLTGTPAPGTPDPWGNILNNTTNINKLFTNITSLSSTIDACCDNQTTMLSSFSGDLINQINQVENDIISIDNTVTTNITNITNSLSSYVDLTTNQIISGEKIFEDPTLVAAPLSVGEDVTIGTGATIFDVCTNSSGETQVTINGLRDDSVHNISALPINSVYITNINGTKVLAIKTT